MPKLNLTADELEMIQERRRRNALINEGWNAGVIEAAHHVTTWLDMVSVGAAEPFNLKDKIASLLRE